jgi:hypothetical protein
VRVSNLFRRVTAVTTVVLLCALPSSSYLPDYTKPEGRPAARSHWEFGAFEVTWRLNPRTRENVNGERSVEEVVQASFNTWTEAPNTALSVMRGDNTDATSAGFNRNSTSNFNLICFVCDSDQFGENSGTLALAMTFTATAVGQDDGHGGRARAVGQIVDADIIFNPTSGVQWSTGDAPGQDLQTVATHEIGHFLGLDHSAVVRAMMFPFAPPIMQRLSYDDVAGISTTYPKAQRDIPSGVITGRVHFSNGDGPFGAHVFANPISDALAYGENIRKSPIGILTFGDGSYRIEGVPADQYIVITEPLDEPVELENIPDYPEAFDRTGLQTNFTTRWH